jgi:thiol-disulfide isomerase/thioredoxin
MPIEHSVEFNRNTFITQLQENSGLLIVKFGATWCGPCTKLNPYATKMMDEMLSLHPSLVRCITVDIDDSFDLYAHLKSRKVVKSIPSLLCYLVGNTTIYPDEVVSTSDETEVGVFFDRCKMLLQKDVKIP